MNIVLKRIHIENFKVFKDKVIDFGRTTRVFAQNYKGKSSIADAFNWCLFGKSATGNSEGKQFTPRRYDADGTPIDHVDVVVELLIEVDGREITVKKVQSQKWVRKRGDETQTYEGDKNSYFWNEVEVSETDHKKRVAELVDEEVFRLITNPHAFVGKKQDEQRKFLVEKVAQITDSDVFSIDGGFAILRSKMLDEGKTLEEVKAINKKALQGYKSQQESIPIRIDETSKLIIDVDFAEQELALSALKIQLAEMERKISDTSEAYGEVTKIKSEIADYRSKLTEIETTEKNALAVKRRDIQSKLDNASYSLVKASQSKLSTANEIDLLTQKISAWEISFETMKKRYSEEKSKEMDESANLCPVCGKEFDEDKKAELLEKFETDKKAKLTQINLDGKKVSEDIKINKAKVTELETQLSTLTAEIDKLTEENTAVKAEIDTLPTDPDLSGNKDYQDYKASLTALEFALKETEESLTDTNTLKANLTSQKDKIQGEIDTVKSELAKKQSIEDAKDRVEELRAELKTATAKAAECERLEWEIEKFEKAKMNLLSEHINSKFKVVKWKLWRELKNGGMEPYCVCQIHGIDYGENTTSTTERLMAGMDIVATLQDIYGVKAPIWLDNSESYNPENVPDIDCQIIQLFVSEDQEMRIECRQE
jgi:DNA repair exonuclease SbcCD ATPase subunit